LDGRRPVIARARKSLVTDAGRVAPGETYTVRPRRPHFVTNVGMNSAVFLVLQFYRTGEYDFVPLT